MKEDENMALKAFDDRRQKRVVNDGGNGRHTIVYNIKGKVRSCWWLNEGWQAMEIKTHVHDTPANLVFPYVKYTQISYGLPSENHFNFIVKADLSRSK